MSHNEYQHPHLVLHNLVRDKFECKLDISYVDINADIIW